MTFTSRLPLSLTPAASGDGNAFHPIGGTPADVNGVIISAFDGRYMSPTGRRHEPPFAFNIQGVLKADRHSF